jgi:hypothetical protein
VGPYMRVGHGILRTIMDEVTRARRPGDLPACTGYHARVLGLPCAHHVRLQVVARRPLPLALVAERWHLRLALIPAHIVNGVRRVVPGNGGRAGWDAGHGAAAAAASVA